MYHVRMDGQVGIGTTTCHFEMRGVFVVASNMRLCCLSVKLVYKRAAFQELHLQFMFCPSFPAVTRHGTMAMAEQKQEGTLPRAMQPFGLQLWYPVQQQRVA